MHVFIYFLPNEQTFRRRAGVSDLGYIRLGHAYEALIAVISLRMLSGGVEQGSIMTARRG